MKWLRLAVPSGWDDVLVRTVKLAVIVFVVLQVEELVETGGVDTPAAVMGVVLISGGSLVVDAILTAVTGGRRPQ